jgi:carbamoyltransferase
MNRNLTTSNLKKIMSNSILVLGIHEGHDAGAALIQDGKVVAAISEERIRNIKHYSGHPSKSIEEVFQISKKLPSEVDIVAIGGLTKISDPTGQNIPLSLRIFYESRILSGNEKLTKFLISNLHKRRNITEIKKTLSNLQINPKEFVFVEHHLAHAATAYYLSPWDSNENVLILTSDGSGDGVSSTVSIGEKGVINRIVQTSFYHSLGNVLYSPITKHLGMKWADHEYKVMGLAPYGKSEYCIDIIKQLIDLDKSNPLKFKNLIGAYVSNINSKLTKLLAGQRFDNIAAATQLWYETLVTKWVKNAVEKTGIHKIACAGGNFLNVKANKLILELDEVDDVFFCPAAGDEGIAVGAALQAYYEFVTKEGKKFQKIPLKDNYFGTSFSNDYIKNVLQKNNLLDKSQFIDNIDEITGELISQPNVVVARFSGGMEWGPRGLGNRSIIADPSDPKIIRKINHAIKMRDFWMPFGPSILSSRINDYLVNGKESPYMIMAFDSIEHHRNDLTAALHPYDFTCRPQTVDSNYNLEYEAVLRSFERKTGRGGILNTSFNLHGYPIVYSPEIALDTFKNSDLDYMALGNYLIKK